VHGRPYCAGLARGNLFAVQFHPEKSQKVGLAFLDRFVRL
jgi:glutamine amidotransferase